VMTPSTTARNQHVSAESLRRPDYRRFSSPRAVASWRDVRQVDICSPLAKLDGLKSIDWERPQQENRTWRLYFYAGCWLFTLLRDWEETKPPAQRDAKRYELVRLLLSLCEFFGLRSREKLERLDALEDHSVAWRVSVLSYFSLRHDLHLDAALRRQMFECTRDAVLLLKEFLTSKRWSGSNHTIFHAEAVFDACLAFPGEEMFDDARVIARAALRELYVQWFDPVEGATTEQAAYYHAFNMSLLQQHGEYLAGIGEANLLASVDYARIFGFLDTLVGGAEFLPPIGDTSIRSPSRLQDQRNLLFLNEGGEAAEPPIGSFMYSRTGYHIFRRKDELVGLTSAVYLTKSRRIHHGHFDGGSYLIERNGRWIVSDCGGPYAYGNKVRFGHFMRPSAHNCLILDDLDESGLSVPVASSAEEGWVCSASPGIPKARHFRWLYVAPTGVVVVVDRIVKASNTDPVVLVHTDIEANLVRESASGSRIVLGSENLFCSFASTVEGVLAIYNPTDREPRARATREHESIECGGLLEYRVPSREMYICHVFSPFGLAAIQFEVGPSAVEIVVRDAGDPIALCVSSITCRIEVGKEGI